MGGNKKKKTKTNSVALSPRANFTDWSTEETKLGIILDVNLIGNALHQGTSTCVQSNFPALHISHTNTVIPELKSNQQAYTMTEFK
jgi:hypothetical protein